MANLLTWQSVVFQVHLRLGKSIVAPMPPRFLHQNRCAQPYWDSAIIKLTNII